MRKIAASTYTPLGGWFLPCRVIPVTLRTAPVDSGGTVRAHWRRHDRASRPRGHGRTRPYQAHEEDGDRTGRGAWRGGRLVRSRRRGQLGVAAAVHRRAAER